MQTEPCPLKTLPTVRPEDAEVDVEVLRAVPKRFCVEDEKTANWLIKKIVSARQYSERVKAWAEQEQRRAEREEHTLMFLFGRQIEAWVRAQIDSLHGNRKSIALPAGTVGFRIIAPKLVIDDEKAVIVWAKQNLPEAVLFSERLSKNALNELLKATGVIPNEGARVEAEQTHLFIR